MKMRAGMRLGFVVISMMVLGSQAEAKISVNPDFEGTLMITTPEGKVVMLDAGNPVPEIPSQSTIEGFQGNLMLTLEPGDSVATGCLGATGSASGPATLSVQCGESEGLVKVIKGTLVFDKFSVSEGEQKSLPLEKKAEAPPTAAGDELGTPTELGAPAVDSRSLQSSPSQ